MEEIGSLIAKRKKKERPPNSAHAAAVNEIIAFMRQYPKEQQMPRGYWDRKVKGASYAGVLAILKKAKDLPPQYKKGGYITNQLKALL